jgi:hypothetical protein
VVTWTAVCVSLFTLAVINWQQGQKRLTALLWVVEFSLRSSLAGTFGALITPYPINVNRLVYTLVQRHIEHLQGLSPEVDEMAADLVDDFDEEAPLLRSLSPTRS